MSQSRRNGPKATSSRPGPYQRPHKNGVPSIASRLSRKPQPSFTFTPRIKQASTPTGTGGLFANHVVTELAPPTPQIQQVRILAPTSTAMYAQRAPPILSRIENNGYLQPSIKNTPNMNGSAILSRLSSPTARLKSSLPSHEAEILDLTKSEEPVDVDCTSPPYSAAASPRTTSVSIKGQSEGPTSITIKNLHLEATDADVQACFMEFGQINHVMLFKNGNGNSTGVAQVTFAKRSPALAAIAKYHGQLADGNLLEVFETKPASTVVGASRRSESTSSTPTTTNATKPSASSFSYSAVATIPPSPQKQRGSVSLPKRPTSQVKSSSKIPPGSMYADREEAAAKARSVLNASAGKTMFSNAVAKILPTSPSATLGIAQSGAPTPMLTLGSRNGLINKPLSGSQSAAVRAVGGMMGNISFSTRLK